MVRLFTLKDCPVCKELKDKLGSKKIEYQEYDVDEYEQTFEKLSEKSGSEQLPMVIVSDRLLAPEISFKTVDKAVELIEKFNKEEG